MPTPAARDFGVVSGHAPERPRRPSADATRRRLLDAGREVFSRDGYSGTVVQDLLAKAGIAAPVLYHHFGSKLGLFVAVADEVYTEFVAELKRATASSTSLDQAFDALLDAAIRLHAQHPTLAPMAFTVQIEARRDEHLASAVQPVLRSFRTYIDELALLSSDALAGTDQDDIARALIAVLNGIASLAVTLSHPDDLAPAVAVIRTVFISGLR